MRSLDQHTLLFGVVGTPIGHSLSPAMHNAAFEDKGLNAVYLAFETGDPEGIVSGMRAFKIRGLSVTIPLKTSVIPHLDEVDETAEKIGAVNTIVNNEGRLKGYNTDAMGAAKALEEKTELKDKICLIIGAGGAARAIGFILKEKGVRLIVANRSVERGEGLARALDCPFVPLERLGNQRVDLLIQTTPVGMHPHVDQSPVQEDILHQGMIVMDIIYNPIETRLLKQAKAGDCLTINGLGMFVYQGAEQFRLWTNMEPPVSAMRRVVEESLVRRQ
ncbi:MAG: shikimate dehydrogenase [Desulfatiglans sp.]|nr:shikimate dehydrogenase [Desulfatiglans sp.]